GSGRNRAGVATRLPTRSGRSVATPYRIELAGLAQRQLDTLAGTRRTPQHREMLRRLDADQQRGAPCRPTKPTIAVAPRLVPTEMERALVALAVEHEPRRGTARIGAEGAIVRPQPREPAPRRIQEGLEIGARAVPAARVHRRSQ